MKNSIILLILFVAMHISFVSAQTDTISNNIYQYNGNLGIGTRFPTSKFTLITDEVITNPTFGICNIRNNHYATFDGFSASDVPFVGSLINGRRSRGTLDNPQNVIAGDRISGIVSAMYYEGEFRFSSGINFYAGQGLDYYSYPSYMVFRTTGVDESVSSERMRLSEEGHLGIGTDNPASRLTVANGDIFVEDISYGIIMKSPNGQCWKGILNNDGMLVFSLIDCPAIVYNNNGSNNNSEENQDILVYPNPGDDILNIQLTENHGYHQYVIINMKGEATFGDIIESDFTRINISSLAQGSYLIRFHDKSGKMKASEKFIKK